MIFVNVRNGLVGAVFQAVGIGLLGRIRCAQRPSLAVNGAHIGLVLIGNSILIACGGGAHRRFSFLTLLLDTFDRFVGFAGQARQGCGQRRRIVLARQCGGGLGVRAARLNIWVRIQ